MNARLGPWGKLLLTVYVVSTAIPLFVLPGHRTTNLTQILWPAKEVLNDRQPLRLHWVVGLAFLVAAYFLARWLKDRQAFWPPRTRLIVALGLVFLLALIAGLFVRPGALNVVYFVQTTIPLIGFFAGAALAESASGLRRVSVALIAATTLSIVLMLILVPYLQPQPEIYGVGDRAKIITSFRLARAIPQVRDYFPFVVAASLSLALASFHSPLQKRQRLLLAAAVAVHLAFYSIAWSRMGFIMLTLVMIWPLLFWRPSRSVNPWLIRFVGAAGVLTVALLLMTQASSIGARWGTGGFLDSDNRRVQYAIEGAAMIAEQPLLGSMFIANWDYDPGPGRELRIQRMFKAHNQYLDYGIRGGIAAMILLGMIMWFVARDLRHALKHSTRLRSIAIGVSGALLAVSVGNLTSLFLVQAQTGSLAWILVGISCQLGEMARRSDSLPVVAPADSD